MAVGGLGRNHDRNDSLKCDIHRNRANLEQSRKKACHMPVENCDSKWESQRPVWRPGNTEALFEVIQMTMHGEGRDF
jgi:hypothetical protein